MDVIFGEFRLHYLVDYQGQLINVLRLHNKDFCIWFEMDGKNLHLIDDKDLIEFLNNM